MKMWDETKNVDMVDDIMEFAKRFCPDQLTDAPRIPDENLKALRRRMIVEEVVEELLVAMDTDDLVEVADAGCDSIVVIIGMMIAYGIPIKECWREVHRSNMAKAQPDGSVKRREDGKVLKPEGWTPPNIYRIINHAMGGNA